MTWVPGDSIHNMDHTDDWPGDFEEGVEFNTLGPFDLIQFKCLYLAAALDEVMELERAVRIIEAMDGKIRRLWRQRKAGNEAQEPNQG